MQVAIVGAGISGLIAARMLGERHEVSLFEKARGVAGRMATRRVPEHGVTFDHGAQYFTIRDPRCQELLEDWTNKRWVAAWEGRITALGPGAAPREENPQRFVGVPGMSGLAKGLAEGLNIHLQTRITSATLDRFDDWILTDDQHLTYGPFDLLIVTTPPAQAVEILGSQNPWLELLFGVVMNPCWATMVLFESPLEVPFDGAFVQGSPLAWIARDSSKPGRNSDRDCWVLHGSQEWSIENLEDAPERIGPRMVDALAEIVEIPLPKVVDLASHRWRYSIPAVPLKRPFLWDQETKLGLCGDWCDGPRVEGAILSGLQLAKIVLEEDSPQLE